MRAVEELGLLIDAAPSTTFVERHFRSDALHVKHGDADSQLPRAPTRLS